MTFVEKHVILIIEIKKKLKIESEDKMLKKIIQMWFKWFNYRSEFDRRLFDLKDKSYLRR